MFDLSSLGKLLYILSSNASNYLFIHCIVILYIKDIDKKP